MFSDLWRLCYRIVLVIGLLLTLFAILELVRFFIFFYGISPVAAYLFGAIVALVFLGVFAYLAITFAAYPKALVAPPLSPIDKANYKEMRKFCIYLKRYLGRLSTNRLLDDDQMDLAEKQIGMIQEVLEHHPLKDDLKRLICDTETKVIAPILEHLRTHADQEVRRSVRDVMLGVSLSPYHSVDLLVVLYRNSAMVLKIVRIYASRPIAGEQIRILRDVVRVLVTVNFLYIGRNLVENLFSNLPFVGRVVDDIGQGLGAGLFTSAAGHAAKERCAAYHGWDKTVASQSLASQTKMFLTDVRDIFTQDVLPNLMGRIRSENPTVKEDESGFWNTLTGGLSTALEVTSATMDTLLIKPAVAGTKGVVQAGKAVGQGLVKAGSSLTGPGRDESERSEAPGKTLATKLFRWLKNPLRKDI